MSRYAEKRKSIAPCKVRECDNPGTKLEVREGVVNWYCTEHAQTE